MSLTGLFHIGLVLAHPKSVVSPKSEPGCFRFFIRPKSIKTGHIGGAANGCHKEPLLELSATALIISSVPAATTMLHKEGKESWKVKIFG